MKENTGTARHDRKKSGGPKAKIRLKAQTQTRRARRIGRTPLNFVTGVHSANGGSNTRPATGGRATVVHSVNKLFTLGNKGTRVVGYVAQTLDEAIEKALGDKLARKAENIRVISVTNL